MSKKLLGGILLIYLILVLAAYVIVYFVKDKVFEISDIITILNTLIVIVLGILQYLQNEKALKLNEQALEEQKQTRSDAMIDSTIEKLIQSHSAKHSNEMKSE